MIMLRRFALLVHDPSRDVITSPRYYQSKVIAADILAGLPRTSLLKPHRRDSSAAERDPTRKSLTSRREASGQSTGVTKHRG